MTNQSAAYSPESGLVAGYNALEESLNSITHGAGAVLSLIGMVMLIVMASLAEDVWKIVSFSI